MSTISYVRRKGQKTIRIKACASGIVVTYPYRYPLFLVKRSVLSGNAIQKIIDTQKQKEGVLRSLSLPCQIFEEHSLKERRVFEKEYSVLLEEYITSVAREMSVLYKEVYYKRTKSRFGSCSSKGVLTFHYKIFFMNESMKRYLVVHELAHLSYMNHSKEFWERVRTFVPHMEEAKQQLLLLSAYL